MLKYANKHYHIWYDNLSNYSQTMNSIGWSLDPTPVKSVKRIWPRDLVVQTVPSATTKFGRRSKNKQCGR